MIKRSLAFISSVLLVSPSVFALNTLSNFENSSLNIPNQVAQGNTSEISESVYELSKQITVEITTNDNRGSGTLLSKNNNTYLVLTNAHVINNTKTVTLKTYDGKIHQGTLVNNSLIDSIADNYDLVVIEFTSEQEYTVPTEDISTPSENNPVIAGGYVAETGEYLVTEGKVTHNLSQSFKEGYNFGYTNNIKQGMSGGPILSSMGELIGINGRSAHPILNIGYVYENGAIPTDEEIEKYRQVSWGIPINTLLTYIKDEIAIAYKLPYPQDVSGIGNPTHTGYIAELEEKAKQFLVKIDSSSGGNGSGVIIAKEGNVYTVLTADHVLCEKGWNAIATAPCIEQYSYTITTHDGKTIKLDESTITRQEGVDLAVFKFKSNDNYAVAELADYNPNRNDFVFAAGFPNIRNDEPEWLFSGGLVHNKEQGLLNSRQSDFSNQQGGALQSVASLTGGYELVYTSITYGGMSGGAVLDAQGRVIGIHGRSEGAGGSGIQLGYSLGIPISTFVGLQDRLKAKPQFLTTANPKTNAQQKQEIINAISEIKIPNTRATAKIWIERGGQLSRLFRFSEAIKAFDEAIKQNNPENVYLAWYGKGLAFAGDKQDQAAVKALQEAINNLSSPSTDNYSAEFHSSILRYQSIIYRSLEEYEKGLTAINQAIKLSSQNPNYHNEKWIVLTELNRYEEALEAINQAIKLAPRAAWYNNRGFLYYYQQQYDLALADFNQALQLNPNFANAYNNRGLLYNEQQQYDLALADFDKALQLNPNFAQAYNNRGLLYDEQQQYDLALADFNQALQLNPNLVEVYNHRGNLYKNQQKWNLALADFNQALQLNPNDAPTYNNRGGLYDEQQQWDLALADFNQALQLNPNYTLAYYNRGVLYKNQQQWDLALADFNQAIKLNPNDADAYYNRGLLYDEQQQYDLALADYNQAIKLNPNNALAYYNRGLLYKNQQKWDLALADYNQALQINPNYVQAYNNRGVLYKNQQKWDLALADYNQALQINPNYANGYYNRGLLYYYQEQWDLALADYNQAIKLNPNDALAYNDRGIIYAIKGEFKTAIADVEKAVQLFDKQEDKAGYKNAQELLKLIRKEMNNN